MDARVEQLDGGEQIEAVLRAERSAEAAVEAARQQARELVEAARDRARVVRERADRRIAALHASAARATEQRIAALREEAREHHAQLSRRRQDPAALRAAVEAVADFLLRSEP